MSPIGAKKCGCERGRSEEFQGNFHTKNLLMHTGSPQIVRISL